MNWDFIIQGKSAIQVTTDSRKISKGCIFVGLKGEHFDGNEYATQALEEGAAYAIIDNPKYFTGARTILVNNSLKALQDLARAWRSTFDIPIIAITGTNGKTTTKELTATVLKTHYNLLYTQGNYNNSLGVPLTLLQLTREHQLAIIEMGASHPGDIRELVQIAHPTYGLITNVGRAHLAGFGSFEGVQRTKAELYEYLVKHKGTIFQNISNSYLVEMLKTCAPEYAHLITYTPGVMPQGTHLVGDYNAENIYAALTIGKTFGISDDEGLCAIREYIPTNNRSQAMKTANNTLVVDAYNANPTSMQAAITAFLSSAAAATNESPYKDLVFILGEMRELGEYSHLEHQNVVNRLLEQQIKEVYLVGNEYAQTSAPYPIYQDVDALYEYLNAHPLKGKHILVKGSRGNQLEKILTLL